MKLMGGIYGGNIWGDMGGIWGDMGWDIGPMGPRGAPGEGGIEAAIWGGAPHPCFFICWCW